MMDISRLLRSLLQLKKVDDISVEVEKYDVEITVNKGDKKTKAK